MDRFEMEFDAMKRWAISFVVSIMFPDHRGPSRIQQPHGQDPPASQRQANINGRIVVGAREASQQRPQSCESSRGPNVSTSRGPSDDSPTVCQCQQAENHVKPEPSEQLLPMCELCGYPTIPASSPPTDENATVEQPENHVVAPEATREEPRLGGESSSHCDVENPPLTIQQFVEHVKSKGSQGLAKEYQQIALIPPNGSFTISQLPHNEAKNRYSNILCFDHSRVLLAQENDDHTTDYINANYVDGYNQLKVFISTQGPRSNTTADFWRMVWEQQCLVIAMTTNLVEDGVTKCNQYWEPDVGGTATYGNLVVRTTKVETCDDYTVTSLDLICTKTKDRRQVRHFQFTSWPDFKIPNSAAVLLDFVSRVRRTQQRMVSDLGDRWTGHPRGPPIVTHCSAGVGRTGTFTAIYISILRLEDAGTVDVRGTVEKIRSQRAHSIQTPEQYILCHPVLIARAVELKLIPPVDLSQLLL